MQASSGSPAASDIPRPRTTPCPRCTATAAEATTSAGPLVYLRCQICSEIWSIEERRQHAGQAPRSRAPI